MILLKIEFELIKKDLLVILLTSIVLSTLNSIIYIKSRVISSNKVLQLLFEAGSFPNENWVFWIFYCMGYIILLQLVWKNHIHLFELQQILRHKCINRYWRTKLLIGLIFTFFYVTCTLVITCLVFYLMQIPNAISIIWLAIIFSLIINLYLHAIIWLAIKIYLRVEIANIFVISLLYAGIRIDKPYVPLYYSMLKNINGIPLTYTFIIEAIVIILLVLAILKKAKNMDYL